MREKIVLRAVIELITRTQLAADVETHSSNTNSNRSPANNRHSRPLFFLGRRDRRQYFAGTLSPEVFTIHVHHAEIIAQVHENHVVTAVDTKRPFLPLHIFLGGGALFLSRRKGASR